MRKRKMIEKNCFVYCGDDRCTCIKNPNYADNLYGLPKSPLIKYYSYIFLKPSLIPEQMAIQVGHVCLKAASKFKDYIGFNPDKLNFCMVPFIDYCPEKTHLALLNMKIPNVEFKDHQYSFENGSLKESEEIETTAFMTCPIAEDERGILRFLPLYRVKTKTEFICG